jgi:hypothetical protein
MTDPKTTEEAWMDAMAEALGLAIAPEWRANVMMQLAISRKIAAPVADYPLDDHEDMAPVFAPQALTS